MGEGKTRGTSKGIGRGYAGERDRIGIQRKYGWVGKRNTGEVRRSDGNVEGTTQENERNINKKSKEHY